MKKYKLLIKLSVILQLVIIVFSSSKCKNTTTTKPHHNKQIIHAPGVKNQAQLDSIKKAEYELKMKSINK